MSTISSAFDLLKTAVTTALPNHTLLVNPYSVEENPDVYLNQGVGIGFGTGLNTNREICPKLYVRRAFFIVITRNYFATDLNRSDKESTEKQLFEDELLVLQELLADVLATLDQAVAKTKFLGDNGIETVFGEKDNFLKVIMQFEFEYYETIN